MVWSNEIIQHNEPSLRRTGYAEVNLKLCQGERTRLGILHATRSVQLSLQTKCNKIFSLEDLVLEGKPTSAQERR
jgi:hypothetical protein